MGRRLQILALAELKMKLKLKLALVTAAAAIADTAAAVTVCTFCRDNTLKVLIMAAVIAVTVAVTALVFNIIIYLPIKRLNERIKDGKAVGRTNADRKDEIGELYNSYMMLMSKLDNEKAAQTRIIASISHDIKTPLTSVLGYAEFLQNPNLSEERRKKYLATIYEKAKVIQQTVIGFDDYLSHNLELNLNREFVTVGKILSDTEKNIASEMLKDGLKVEFEDCGCENVTVYADIMKLQRVFMNAVTNSVRHSGRNDLKITVSAKESGPDIVFRIQDNGKGVKRDQLEKVFEPMYTTDTSRSVAGLGLSICKEIVESHGGAIRAESVYNEYFALCFTLKKVEQNEV